MNPRPLPAPGHLAILALGALGVVYGDIGTSPLYALKECFTGPHGVPLTQDNVLGVLSLVFWSLNFVVTFKYLSVVMRADNRGEGGILALLALVRPHGEGGRRRGTAGWSASACSARRCSTATASSPRRSRCSARWKVSASRRRRLQPWMVPIAVVDHLGAVCGAAPGTAGIGAIFGPVTMVWFVCIAVLGIMGILPQPSVLAALNPWYAASFLCGSKGVSGFLVLAAVVLVVTGGEALYADMGHFGKRPIRVAWYAGGAAGAGAQLLRPGRHPARVPGGGPQPVLLAGAGLGALPDGGDRHRRRGRRVAGADLRRVLADPAGGAAGLLPAGEHRAYLEHARSARSTSRR